MATIRVHEDQENRIGDVRRIKDATAVGSHQGHPLQQTKRPVLAVLHNNCHRNAKTVSIMPFFFLSFFFSFFLLPFLVTKIF